MRDIDIKRLCIANGDEYENTQVDMDLEAMKDCINQGEVIEVRSNGKRIIINSEFIVSFEVGESKKLVKVT